MQTKLIDLCDGIIFQGGDDFENSLCRIRFQVSLLNCKES